MRTWRVFITSHPPKRRVRTRCGLQGAADFTKTDGTRETFVVTSYPVHTSLSSGFLKTRVNQDARLRAILAFQRRTHNWGHELNHQAGQPLGYRWITKVHGQQMSVTMYRRLFNGKFFKSPVYSCDLCRNPSNHSFTGYSCQEFEKLFRHSSIDFVGKVRRCKADRSTGTSWLLRNVIQSLNIHVMNLKFPRDSFIDVIGKTRRPNTERRTGTSWRPHNNRPFSRITAVWRMVNCIAIRMRLTHTPGIVCREMQVNTPTVHVQIRPFGLLNTKNAARVQLKTKCWRLAPYLFN
jgi:hypothetical protein